jgi:hypothetical protein
VTIPPPNIDHDNRAFWDGVNEGRFLLTRCGVCGAWYWPISYCREPHPAAPFMGDLSWVQGSGRGKVFAFNVHNVALEGWLTDRVPYVNAIIELEEGPMFGTNVVDCPTDELRIGMPVDIVIRDVGGVKLPLAVPAAPSR